MDPVSRRHVWNLIQELKQNRVIILTTHSMYDLTPPRRSEPAVDRHMWCVCVIGHREEADVLGDRIAIMSHGEIKCLGTPLHLKNKYGDGYRINVTARPDAIEEAKAHINELLPGTTPHATRRHTHIADVLRAI
jgi:ABC-type multidrug transport system ATPase subunit